jgi:bacterial/archaeal transporter family-2 protein
MRVLLFAMATAAGAAAACQAAANAALSARAGLGAALFLNTLIVLAGTIVMLFASGGPRTLPALAGAPLHHYVGGLCGFVIIGCLTFALPRLGAATAVALMVLGQGVLALIIDHFGLWGIPTVAVSGPRLLGVALLVAGVVLLRR